MAIKTKQFRYKTALTWTGGKRGLSSCEDDKKPPIELSMPPEFRGDPGYWTPEDLFVASLNGCLMTTFLAVAAREELEVVSYSCSAEGILESDGGSWRFSRVILRPSLTLPADEDPDLAHAVLEMAEQSCIISSSVSSKIELEPEIKVDSEQIP